jgi:predicted TIM-barrel fold metal-dependent hydrolase
MDSRFEEEKTDPASAAFYKNYKKSPAQCFRENFYVTISGMFWQPALQFVSSVLGSDRIMFATDYPYESSKVAADFMESVQIDEADRRNICYANAESILGLQRRGARVPAV